MKKIIITILIIIGIGLVWLYAQADTFGNEAIGGTEYATRDTIRGVFATPGVSGEVTKITAYVVGSNNAIGKGMIYDSSNNLVGETNQEDISGEGAIDFTFSSNPSVTGGQEYAIVFWGDSDLSAGIKIFGDGSVTDGGFETGVTYDGSAPATWSPTTADVDYSIFATFTPSDPPPPAVDSTVTMKAGTIEMQAGTINIK